VTSVGQPACRSSSSSGAAPQTRDRAAYAKLKTFADGVADARIETKNAILEESIEAIADFVRRGSRQTSPFTFIDPTGWTGSRTLATTETCRRCTTRNGSFYTWRAREREIGSRSAPSILHPNSWTT
jgi:hypothetical protein